LLLSTSGMVDAKISDNKVESLSDDKVELLSDNKVESILK